MQQCSFLNQNEPVFYDYLSLTTRNQNMVANDRFHCNFPYLPNTCTVWEYSRSTEVTNLATLEPRRSSPGMFAQNTTYLKLGMPCVDYITNFLFGTPDCSIVLLFYRCFDVEITEQIPRDFRGISMQVQLSVEQTLSAIPEALRSVTSNY